MSGNDLRLLLTLPGRLCSARWVRAIEFARVLGRASAEYLGPLIRDGIQEGHLPFLQPVVYLEMIVVSSAPEGLVSEEELQSWRRAFEDGRAARDPRVQAFGAGLAERIAELTASVLQRRKLLARYLEIPQASLSLSGIAPGGVPVFMVRGECFLVTDSEEAEGLGAGRIRALCGHDGRSCEVESCPFLGMLIHRSRN
ncbi:MAG: hypothetical protein U5R14_11870 [Gemmatimonadota bacterium]|nr:hypothetical protein [Gemmatimonadota bacterium]